jgi:thiamine biosynthesis lipoprotein
MNTSVLVAAADGPLVESGLDAASHYIVQAELRFSRFVPDSELCQLNASAGAWVSVSADLMDMLQLSKAYHEATGGLFDPCVLPDLVRAGYDKSMDENRRLPPDDFRPSATQRRASTAAAQAGQQLRRSFSQVELNQDNGRVRLPAEAAIDLGGIAKGWIVQRAAELLAAFAEPCAVNAGGDMFFVGRPDNESGWRVELEDPVDSNQTVAVLQVGPGAVVTSSVTKRRWKSDSLTMHHIFDPRSGEPARSDWLSVTVIAATAPAAEVYAKALLIGGPAEAARVQACDPHLGFVAVDRLGHLYASQNHKEFMNDHA